MRGNKKTPKKHIHKYEQILASACLDLIVGTVLIVVERLIIMMLGQ